MKKQSRNRVVTGVVRLIAFWATIAGLALVLGSDPAYAAPALQELDCKAMAESAAVDPSFNTLETSQASVDEPPLKPKFEAAVRKRLQDQAKLLPKQKLDPNKVALFGTLFGVGKGCLVMNTFEPITASQGIKVLSTESLPGMGITGRTIMVLLRPQAHITAKGNDLATFPRGTPILVGGSLSGNTLTASLVADLRLAQPHQPVADDGGAARVQGTWRQVMPAEQLPLTVQPGTNGTTTSMQANMSVLDFKGGLIGPAYEYAGEPNIQVADTNDIVVTLKRASAIASAGFSFDFPFAFQANANSEAVAGQNSTFSLLVQSQSPAQGYDSFYGGIGLNVGFDLHIDSAIGSFDVPLNLGVWIVNSTTGAPPMLGQTLETTAVQCPFLGSLPLFFNLYFCNALKFEGASFYANVSATNGTITSGSNTLAFNGTDSKDVKIMPTANPLVVRLSQFSYNPHLDYGLFLRLKFLIFSVADSPTLWVADCNFPAIGNSPKPTNSCPSMRYDLQPTEIDFPFTVLDKTPPTSTISLSGTAGDNGWYRSNVQVTLAATDNPGGSGVQRIEYGVDTAPLNPYTGPWTVYTGPFTISAEGHTYIVYRSVDKAGNVESYKTQLINIDKTPPSVTVTSPQAKDYAHTASINVVWTEVDSVSGMASSSALLDNKPAANGQVVDLFYLSLGAHTVTVQAKDVAGNAASVSVMFKVVADINSLLAAVKRAYDLGWISKQGVYNSLEAKLNAAEAAIERGQSNTAKNQLNAFMNELDAQKGKALSQQAFELLKTDVLYVIAHLP